MKDQKQRKLAPNHQHYATKPNGDFVGCCDGITYGCENGVPFHTGKLDWPLESQIRWAKANALFYKNVTEKLSAFADALGKE